MSSSRLSSLSSLSSFNFSFACGSSSASDCLPVVCVYPRVYPFTFSSDYLPVVYPSVCPSFASSTSFTYNSHVPFSSSEPDCFSSLSI